MTLAVCVRCGAMKRGTLVPCNGCHQMPATENEVIYSLALSDHYLTRSKLEEVGRLIASGMVIRIGEEQENKLRPAAQDALRMFGPIISDVNLRDRPPRKPDAPGKSKLPLLDPSDELTKRFINSGKTRGYVTYDELDAVLPPDLPGEDIETVFEMLSEMGIDAVEDASAVAGREKRNEADGPGERKSNSDYEQGLFSARSVSIGGETVRVLSLQAILGTHRCIPFSEYENKALHESLHMARNKGRDLTTGSNDSVFEGSDPRGLMTEGILTLCSPTQLETDFLFLKCDAGRTLFRRQKAVYPSFVGTHRNNEWIVGPIFNSFMLAITSPGNAYRGNGFK